MGALVVILVALALGSFVKGVTGTGLPQIAIPVMASFLGVERAVVIMAIPGVISNAILIWTYRHRFRETRDLPVLIVTGIVGAVAGTWLLRILDPRVLAAILAAIIIVYVALIVWKVPVRFSERVTRVASPPVGLAAGALQGATGISGPLLATYLHGYRLDKAIYVLSLTTLFLVQAVTQVGSMVAFDLYTPTRLFESALALVPMLVILPLGARFARRLSAEAFDKWVLVLLVVTAGKLVYDAVVG